MRTMDAPLRAPVPCLCALSPDMYGRNSCMIFVHILSGLHVVVLLSY